MKFLLSLLLSGLVTGNLLAQTEDFTISRKASESIPSSPTAMNFSKYGIIPVTLYSGMPSVSVPLYEVQDGSIRVPITLSYHNRGFKPSEVASNTGLGWSLQAGGMISRIVRGQVDGNVGTNGGKSFTNPYQLQNLNYNDFPDVAAFSDNQNVLKGIADGTIDGEPDIYTFNFNGYSGNFVLVNGEAYLTPKQNLKIIYKDYESRSSFLIISEDGTRYEFDVSGNEVTSRKNAAGQVTVNPYVSGWHLSSITSFDGQHTVSFHYTPVLLKREDSFYGACNLTCFGDGSLVGKYKEEVNYGASIEGMDLADITAQNDSVTFIGSSRNDLFEQGHTYYSIGKIAIHDRAKNFIKQWDFIYGYFGQNQKLKLKALRQTDNTGRAGNQYSFAYYNEDNPIPDKWTRGIDHWNYYNGKDNNGSLIPASELVNGSMSGGTPADRTPDFSSSLTTVLKQITYPTGGYTTFDYESNRYSSSSGYVTNPKDVSLYAYYNTADAKVDPADGVSYVSTTPQTFFICDKQVVNVHYKLTPENFDPAFGIKVFYPFFRIRKILNTCSDDAVSNPTNVVVYHSPPENWHLEVYDTVTLAPGTYVAEVKMDQALSSVFASISYTERTAEKDPGGLGPGLRLAGMTSYSSPNVKATEKRYEYLTDLGYSSGVGAGVQYQKSRYTEQAYSVGSTSEINHTSITGNLETNLGALLNEKFYYTKVSEYSIVSGSLQKTDYYYQAFDEYNGGVSLVKQVDYLLSGGKYLKIHSKEFEYSILDAAGKSVSGLTATLEAKRTGNGARAFTTLDPLDHNAYFERYTGSTPTLSLGAKKLTQETEKTFTYDSIYATLEDSVVSTKNYRYNAVNTKNPREVEQSVGPTKLISLANTYSYDFKPFYEDVHYNIQRTYENAIRSITSSYFSDRYELDTSCQKHNTCQSTTYADTIFKRYSDGYDTLRCRRFRDINALDASMAKSIQSAKDTSTAMAAILLLQANHNVATPVEQKRYLMEVIDSGFHQEKKTYVTKQVVEAVKTIFGITAGEASAYCYGRVFSPKVLDKGVQVAELPIPVDSAAFSSTCYKTQLERSYSDELNLINEKPAGGVNSAYRWGYGGAYPIAKATNALAKDIFYTSFEEDKNSTPLHNARTGRLVMNTTYHAFLGNIAPGSYIKSYWKLTNGTWMLIADTVSVTAGEASSGYTLQVADATPSTPVDELRFYPVGATMVTFTYDPLVGVTSITDQNNVTTYYEYDGFGHLIYIKDATGNVLKQYEYNYVTTH